MKVVQPADGGIVKEILVKEGDKVTAGRVLVRMDPVITQADHRQVLHEYRLRALQLRRIDAELAGVPPARQPEDPADLYTQALAQYQLRRQAVTDALQTEQAALAKAQQDLRAAVEIEGKLRKTLSVDEDLERSWDTLVKEGFAGRLLAEEKRRKRIETEQEHKAQLHAIEGFRASIAQSEKRIAQIHSNTKRELANERVEALSQYEKLKQELAKQTQKHALLELKAPQAGTIKDLSTHTVGAVLQPGAVLMTLVPSEETLRAEVWVGNDDIGFVREGQKVQLKVAPYPFQKYGMVEGTVTHVSADATEPNQTPASAQKPEETLNLASPNTNTPQPYRYKTIVALNAQTLDRSGVRHALNAGMQVNAEILLGERSVIAYVLSPVQRAIEEAGRER